MTIAKPAAPPSTLLQRATLEYKHRLRVFLTWKIRAHTQSVWRKRLYWSKWKAFVAESHQQRQKLETKVCAQSENDVNLSEDRGSDNIGNDMTLIDSTLSCNKNRHQDENNAAVLRRKRHQVNEVNYAVQKHNTETVACTSRKNLCSKHAIRRWHGFVRTKKDWAALQQEAYFLSYDWLLKRFLSQIGHYALTRKRERQLVVKMKTTNRQCLLMKSMRQWRLRIRLCQTLAWWRGRVLQRRRHARLYRPIADALIRKSHHCLFQCTFRKWEKQHTRKRAQHARMHLLDRHLYQTICHRAWNIWNVKVGQLVQIENIQRRYQKRTLQRTWHAWNLQTRATEHWKQQRRRAVRYYYLSLLRQGFHGFQAWLMQQHVVRHRVASLQHAADGRRITMAFSRWDHLTSERKWHADKVEHAMCHYNSRLLKRMWVQGFQCLLTKMLVKKERNVAAFNQHATQIVRRGFRTWKTLWQAERRRNQALDEMVQQRVMQIDRMIRSKVVENWVEITRAKAAKRVVNAQVRGQAHRQMLQKHLMQWLVYISVLRWQAITQGRAEHHHRFVVWRNGFKRWRHNVTIRQRYRRETRVALVHWKLTLQRKAVEGWKRYLHCKRMKQRRMHEALEFRHKQFVREGLRQWMTAALYLQDQREQHIARTQADNTTHIWRKVAAIARHWHSLIIRRRALNDKVVRNGKTVPRRAQMNTNGQLSQYSTAPSQHPILSAPIQWNGDAYRAHERINTAGIARNQASLSAFVMLPKTRPQPRRPVEVLLHSRANTESIEHDNQPLRMNEANRCGFDFPIEDAAALRLSRDKMQLFTISKTQPLGAQVTAQAPKPRQEQCLSSLPVLYKEVCEHKEPITAVSHLDGLERQLMSLCQRKKEWKVSRQQLDTLQNKAKSKPEFLPQVCAMEEQHADRTRRWLRAKKKIQSLAMAIESLKRALQE